MFYVMPLAHQSLSLTQEASLKEVDNLRKQIYRIKGKDTVSLLESID
jgi:hypothetical protein